jgi:hypothetical protein
MDQCGASALPARREYEKSVTSSLWRQDARSGSGRSGQMPFSINVTIEVDQVGNGLAIQTPVAVQLVRERRRWRAECDTPPFRTPSFDTMEQAVIAAGEQAACEVQAAIVERPLIVGRITPEAVATLPF